jgi:hypothetical protein
MRPGMQIRIIILRVQFRRIVWANEPDSHGLSKRGSNERTHGFSSTSAKNNKQWDDRTREKKTRGRFERITVGIISANTVK